MKKLLFFTLFFGINIISFGANVYFLNGGTGYVHDNGQYFYSNEDGYASVAYWIWADPSRYNYTNCGARFQDPNGNWSDWSVLSNCQGLRHCSKAGLWKIEGRVFVNSDIYGRSNYWMYTNQLYFYVIDNFAPAIPNNFQIIKNSNNNPYLTWSGNSEEDFSYYEIWKKGGNEGGDWHLKATTSATNYTDNNETVVTGPAQANEGIAYYKIKAVDINSNKSGFTNQLSIRVNSDPLWKTNNDLAIQYNLSQNYPNPFNPSTKISYVLKESGLVSLKVFDIIGTEIITLVNELQPEGIYEVEFDASNLPSGVYIYSIKINDFSKNQKMILLR